MDVEGTGQSACGRARRSTRRSRARAVRRAFVSPREAKGARVLFWLQWGAGVSDVQAQRGSLAPLDPGLPAG